MAKKQPLKRALVGFEIEFFTLNKNGYVVNAADVLLKKAKKGKSELNVKTECAKNLMEIASYPNEQVLDTMDNLLGELEYLLSIAEKEELLLLPLGSYPGSFHPKMREDKPYMIKQSIFGKNRFLIAGRCAGFHCHYTLPKGIFDEQMRIVKMLVRSKIKDSLVNSYNFLIAADPALSTLMQSSPYYQGKYYGKDSRIIWYRGGRRLDNMKGLYAYLQEFGGLPPYRLTALDILDIVTTRYERWRGHVKNLGINLRVISRYGSVLDTTWNPVKINPNGTLEQRGMDMNHIQYIGGIGNIIKYILKKLQEEFYAVVPSDIGIKEPFKVEGDTVYIPPFAYVKTDLQKFSAYEGLDNDAVYNHCKRFVKFAASVIPKEHHDLINPFKRMIEEKKTVSDEILQLAKKKGFGKEDKLPNKIAAEIAIEHSKRVFKDIVFARELIRASK
tara:strand:- start:199 stop:1530 length:1332 start_codon:yes stop_codon:yes gene_type:complete